MTRLKIEPRLPRYNGRGAPSPEFEALAGATILRIGTAPDLDLEGGGLAIEYVEAGREHSGSHVLILGFNEVGMWVEGTEG